MKRGIIIVSVILLISLILTSLYSYSITGNAVLTGQETISEKLDLSNNTLILYNSNYLEALEIAEYYADARGIDHNKICEVKLPTGQFASVDHLLGARKTIIEDCICASIPEEIRPNPCDNSSLDTITSVSPISHMVIIKGIPARMYGTPWEVHLPTYGDQSEPTFDFYLAHSIYKNLEFSVPSYYNQITKYAEHVHLINPILSYVDGINVSEDKQLIYGRIEAITKKRTKELIDRTVNAENNGFSGNILNTYNINGMSALKFYQEMVSANIPVCEDYIEPPYSLWPYGYCRSGTTVNGKIPGESSAISIPIALNAGFYDGVEWENNGHAAFDGFSNMLNWHKNETNCIELCKDFPNPTDEQNCRNNSTDYFKEINTDCVGVADGFMGHQYISYPVQYYGFLPPKWNVIYTYNGYEGKVEKTPPTIINGSSYKDDYFTDDKYLRYGSLNSSENPTCTLEDGSTESCFEKIGIMLYKDNHITPLYVYNEETKNFTFKIRYRSSPNIDQGRIKVNVKFVIEGIADQTVSKYINIEPDLTTWETKELTFPISYIDNDKDYIEIKKIQFHLISNIREDGVVDWLEIDGLELINEESSENILDIEAGSFNATQIAATHSGDYAANVIDRLGGIGWWGSSSHFKCSGRAFSNGISTFASFFSGRSIGESLSYSGGECGSSGLIYVDPLYRPSAVRIYTENRSITLKPSFPSTNLYPKFSPERGKAYAFNLNDNGPFNEIFINAFHGHNNFDKTNWQLSYCSQDKIICDEELSWIEFESGNNAVYEHKIPINLRDFVENEYLNQNISLRLEVWNPGERRNGLKDYADLYYDYQSGDPEQLCNQDSDCGLNNCDEDRDGIKRCHPNENNCVYGEYEYGLFEIENNNSYCFSDISRRKCIDSEWQEPELCEIGCLTNGECEPESNGRLCQTNADCDLDNAIGYFHCDYDFLQTKRCHSFKNGCIYDETGDEVSINEQYCINSSSLIKCMGNNEWSAIINCEDSCYNSICVKDDYTNYTFYLDNGWGEYLLSFPINTSTPKINSIFDNGFESGWGSLMADRIYTWNNTKQEMGMNFNSGMWAYPFAEWNKKWLKGDSDSSPTTDEIKPGEGFKIKKTSRNNGIREITIYGTKITSPVKTNINGNLSFIGIPFCHNQYGASKVLNEINILDNSCIKISRLNSQSQTNEGWNINNTGINFPIKNYEGYWVYCDENTNINWTPSCNSFEFKYNLTNFERNRNLRIRINGSNITRDNYEEVQRIDLIRRNKSLLAINHNFTRSPLDLENLTILENSSNNKNSLIIQGLNITETKTIYLNRNETSNNAICILDEEINNLTQLQNNCQKISCPGSNGNITCTIENNTFAISGLSHSGVIEDYIQPSSLGTTPDNGNGGNNGGGLPDNRNLTQANETEPENTSTPGTETIPTTTNITGTGQNNTQPGNNKVVIWIVIIGIGLGTIGIIIAIIILSSNGKRTQGIKKLARGVPKDHPSEIISQENPQLQKLKDYIKKAKKLGFSEKQIRNAIQKEGWGNKISDKAFE
jgi:hypothetical protein